jgi:uncharacterized protein YjbI with pentapeptide repeats
MKPPTARSIDLNEAHSIESNSSYEDKFFQGLKTEEGLRINDTEFSNCIFKNCKLFKVSFFDCTFENCKFENCDLASAAIKYTSFRDVTFVDSKLTGILWNEAAVPLDVKFHKCLLNYSGFIQVDLRSTELIECQLREVDFSEANLTKANCSYSDFSGARFMNTNLTRANFTHATNYAIHPHGNKLCKTKFSSPEVLSLLDVFDIIIE